MVCFQTKNSNLGKFLEGHGTENIFIFDGPLEYIEAIWCVYAHLVI
jgi:hypothetical protein